MDTRVVDHQAHWYPRAVLERLRSAGGHPAVEALDGGAGYRYEARAGGYVAPLSPNYFELDLQLESMARNGIDVAVLSTNLLGDVHGLEAGRARELIELLNEQIARAQREHPDRVAGLAMLPLEHPDAALATLERAAGELGLRGVCVLSNIGGAPIVNDALEPLYRRIDELGLPLFLHPANESIVKGRGLRVPVDVGAAWMLDTTAAALTLIYSGLLDRCPNLTVVHPHLGGVLPYVRGRVPLCETPEERNERPLDWYLRNRFYTDSATDTLGTFGLGIDTYGADRILFATDWPWYDHETPLELLRRQGGGAHVATVFANRLPGLLPEV